MMAPTLPRTATTEMEVTSIRLERDLKDRLKTLAGNQGYQALVREVLWNYVQHRSGECHHQRRDICSTVTATAHQDLTCGLTGEAILSGQPMLLGLTTEGTLIPLCPDQF